MFKRLTKATLVAALITLPLTACEVTKTEEGGMRDVGVKDEGGELPEYDVDGPDVDVSTKKVEVTVPDIDVKTPNDPDYEDEDPETPPPSGSGS